MYKEKLEVIGLSIDNSPNATDNQCISNMTCWPCVEYGHIFCQASTHRCSYLHGKNLIYTIIDGHRRNAY